MHVVIYSMTSDTPSSLITTQWCRRDEIVATQKVELRFLKFVRL
jgi:hypothetical protein